MATSNDEKIGRFIYRAHRQGGRMRDITDWMADDLGVARPDPDELQENDDRFIDSLNSRAA